MKAVILAGGFGTRISEESQIKPKPMVEIGVKPIIWHIMKLYSHYGINEFVICCGYKGHIIKEYFSNYFLHHADLTIDLKDNSVEVHSRLVEPWKITLVDTGIHAMTGGRLKRVQKYLDNETFCMTYGDGLSNVNISELIKFHKEKGHLATLTAVKHPGRFGAFVLEPESDLVTDFREKPEGDGKLNAMINGGFFVLEPETLDLIEGEHTIWEREPMEILSERQQLGAFVHSDFWQAMDTLRDKNVLEELWQSGKAPWKVW
jgi:glucose-1-phosphate cytidylyltransferase